ncbi:ATP-binding protein [Kitasatospora sp. NPDC049258]|uniref:ATP-binding protein n=1 Tax=Kitasatospora sp. NPDC049258 TaxID=3155394 RepID=UPI00343BA0F7
MSTNLSTTGPGPRGDGCPAEDRPPRRHGLLVLAAEEHLVCTVRHYVSAVLAGWGVGEGARDAAVLIVGELAANAAAYGGAQMSVSLSLCERALCVEVADFGAVPPARACRRLPREEGEHGRGLAIVHHLADWVETEAATRRCTVRAGLDLTCGSTSEES